MLIDTIKKENLLALKNKDENKRAILSVIINKYMILGYEAKAKNIELTDADLLNIMKKTIKDKVKDITYQMDVVSSYLPKMMSEEEIKAVILSLSDRSIPTVMKHFKQNYNGMCDMGLVNKVLKSL